MKHFAKYKYIANKTQKHTIKMYKNFATETKCIKCETSFKYLSWYSHNTEYTQNDMRHNITFIYLIHKH